MKTFVAVAVSTHGIVQMHSAPKGERSSLQCAVSRHPEACLSNPHVAFCPDRSRRYKAHEIRLRQVRRAARTKEGKPKSREVEHSPRRQPQFDLVRLLHSAVSVELLILIAGRPNLLAAVLRCPHTETMELTFLERTHILDYSDMISFAAGFAHPWPARSRSSYGEITDEPCGNALSTQRYSTADFQEVSRGQLHTILVVCLPLCLGHLGPDDT